MPSLAEPIGAAVILAGLAVKARDLRRDPGNPGLRAICVVLGALGAAVSVGWTPDARAIDRLLGLPNVAKVIEHSLALIAAAAVQALFLHLGDPASARRRTRVRVGVLLAALAVMAVAFLATPVGAEAPEDFATEYGTIPHLAEYLFAYLAYLALAMLDVLRMSLRYARHAPGRLLRFGIRLLSIGSVMGLGYVVHKAAFVTALRLDHRRPWPEQPVSASLVTASILFVTAGLVLPSLGETLQWPRRRRVYRQLHPLWLALYRIAPHLALHPPADPRRDQSPVFSLRYWLYRRVIEIRDGMSAVKPHLDPRVAAAGRRRALDAGLDEASARAVGEAAALAVAMRKAAGQPEVRPAPAPAHRPPADRSGYGGTDVDSDAEWLARIATALVGSPIVARAVGEAGPPGPAPPGPDAADTQLPGDVAAERAGRQR